MSAKEIEILQDELRFVDKRLSEIELIIAHVKPGEYRAQELMSESATLAGHRRVLDRRLRELTGTDDPAERDRRASALARTEALRAAKVRTYREQCRVTAEQFEASGDFRNATIARLEALRARAVAEHEIHD
jgi:hypothetical protein